MKKTLISLFAVAFAFIFGAAQAQKHEAPAAKPAATDAKKADDKKAGDKKDAKKADDKKAGDKKDAKKADDKKAAEPAKK